MSCVRINWYTSLPDILFASLYSDPYVKIHLLNYNDGRFRGEIDGVQTRTIKKVTINTGMRSVIFLCFGFIYFVWVCRSFWIAWFNHYDDVYVVYIVYRP